MPLMRAKMKIGSVTPWGDGTTVASEVVTMHGVSKSNGYPADGTDEDNSFAKFSPSVSLNIQIANPALIGQLTVGQTFYVDFTTVD